MTGNDRLLSAVALCRRAGKLAIGFDATRKALNLAASDAAARTVQNVQRACGAHTEILRLPRTQAQIEQATGRKFAVAAVCDPNLARLIQQNIKEDAK